MSIVTNIIAALAFSILDRDPRSVIAEEVIHHLMLISVPFEAYIAGCAQERINFVVDNLDEAIFYY